MLNGPAGVYISIYMILGNKYIISWSQLLKKSVIAPIVPAVTKSANFLY